jgi:predicted DCC family thiol-disulfide oxidoreductase YuxK
MTNVEPILLFDGVCNLCSGSVQFVLKRNRKGNVRFASLQSDFGKEVLQRSNLPHTYLKSLVLIEHGKTYVKSDAALHLAKHLDGFWKMGTMLLLIPKFIRNPIYDWIARNRYAWFGKKETCWIPEQKWNDRFLDHMLKNSSANP